MYALPIEKWVGFKELLQNIRKSKLILERRIIMSAFLGPIHYWIFDKIKLHEMLESNIVRGYKQVYGNEIEELVKQAEASFGVSSGHKTLDELIDTSNIHGWLQNTITNTERRLAYILTNIFNKHDKDSVDLALRLYNDQGSDCGMDAKANHSVSTAPEIYKAMNNFLLEGMPCDQVYTVTVSTDDKVEWQNVECLHKCHWQSVNADIDTFYMLRSSWIRAFVESANEKYTYSMNAAKIHGLQGFIHEIIKK